MTFQRLRDVHFFSCYSALFTPFASILSSSPLTHSHSLSLSLSHTHLLSVCLYSYCYWIHCIVGSPVWTDITHLFIPLVYFFLFFFSPRLSCCSINHLTFRFPLRSYASAILPRCRREDVERRLRLRFASSGHQSQRKSISLFRLESS